MEWNRSGRPSQPGAQPAPVNQQVAHHPVPARHSRKGIVPSRVASVILLFSVTALIIAVIGFLMFGKDEPESKYVDTSKMQAVFLNGGQVYFGRIQTLNSRYVRVSGIYYLRVNQQVQPDQKANQAQQQDISLVKLGCELHGPTDEMLINREQVVFWENLKDDGQVAKAVDQYKKANPDGQKCSTGQQSGGNGTSATPTAPATTPVPSTAPTTTR